MPEMTVTSRGQHHTMREHESLTPAVVKLTAQDIAMVTSANPKRSVTASDMSFSVSISAGFRSSLLPHHPINRLHHKPYHKASLMHHVGNSVQLVFVELVCRLSYYTVPISRHP